MTPDPEEQVKSAVQTLIDNLCGGNEPLLVAQFKDRVAAAQEIAQRLGRRGGNFDPISLVGMRVEWLANQMMPVGTEERLVAEMEWQEMLLGQYMEAEAGMNRALLLQPGVAPPNGVDPRNLPGT